MRRFAACILLYASFLCAIVALIALSPALGVQGVMAYSVERSRSNYMLQPGEIFLHDMDRGIVFNLTETPSLSEIRPVWVGREALIYSAYSSSYAFGRTCMHYLDRRAQCTDATREIHRRRVWSPEGDRLAALENVDGRQRLVIHGPDGSAYQVRDSAQMGSDFSPAWSPDGAWIAFAATVDGDWDIFVASVDSSGVPGLPERVFDSPNFEDQPAWRPDSMALSFVSNTERSSNQVFVVTRTADGFSAPQRVTSFGADYGTPVWMP